MGRGRCAHVYSGGSGTRGQACPAEDKLSVEGASFLTRASVRRVDSVFSAFGKFEGFRASKDEEFIQKAGGDNEKRPPGGGSKYYRFWKHREECEIPAPEPARENAEKRSGGSRGGHPTERELDTLFLTGKRVQSVKMNFFIEKGGDVISEDDAHYCPEEDAKMIWRCVRLGSGPSCSSNSRRAWMG